MRERWHMNRIGFVNFWLYDDEVFSLQTGNCFSADRMVPENLSQRRVLFLLYWTGTERPAGWILLAPMTGEWNIIF